MKCIQDEIPFEVPEGWEWCRLRDLFSVCSAKRVLQSEWKTEGIPFYRAREIVKLAETGFVDNELFITEEHYNEMVTNYGIPQKNDLMVSAVGTIGKIYIVKENDRFYYKDASVICFQNIDNIIDSRYAKLMLESTFLQYQMTNNSKGTTVDTITISTAQSYLCILPSLREQIDIVISVEKVLTVVQKINNEKHNLKQLIIDIQSKILNLAICGKLVPQDPNDEPASVLLERIRVEKEELIKQGKIKRDKKESIIFKGDDNSYYERVGNSILELTNEELFDLPNGWEYVRLKDITIKLVDGSHNPPKGENYRTEYIMASSRNINNDTIVDLENVRYISKEEFEKENERTNISKNDILLTTVATLGRSCIYQNIPPNLCLQRSVTVITPLIITPQYLKLFFDSSYFQKLINKEATGTAQKGFYLNQLENVLVPIPPFNEQYAITSYANKLLAQLNDIMNVVRE